jgi:hypothetical protein
MFCDTVGSEKRKARLRTGPQRTVGTQPHGSTAVSTVQRVIAWVDLARNIPKNFLRLISPAWLTLNDPGFIPDEDQGVVYQTGR